MMGLKVSVITPCLNSSQTIQNTIESVLNQTYKEIEYIIVDGMSTDNTLDIIKRYKASFAGRLRFISEKDRGIYDAMNKGIACASGDVIGIINSDDWYEPDAVERVARCFRETGADVVYGEMWFVDEDGRRECHTWHSAFPPHPSTFIKRSAYQKQGMFDTAYQIAADRELLLRFKAGGLRFEHIDSILANFRKTGISNVRSLKCAEETYEIDLQYLGRCSKDILNKESAEEKYDREKLLYISKNQPKMIREMLEEQYGAANGVIIFGAGVCGKELETILTQCCIPVRVFVDNDSSKWGLELHGIKILSPEILRHDEGHVIITMTRFQHDVCRQLQNYGNPALSWSTLWEMRQRLISRCNNFWERGN